MLGGQSWHELAGRDAAQRGMRSMVVVVVEPVVGDCLGPPRRFVWKPTISLGTGRAEWMSRRCVSLDMRR